MEKIKLYWKEILLITTLIIIGISCVFFYKVFKARNNVKDVSTGVIIKNLFTCAKEGETIGNPKMPARCCGGLKAISGIGDYTGDCSSSYVPPTGGLSLCSNCGDGVCNSFLGEDKCNCSKDCEAKDEKTIEKCAGAGQKIDTERKSCCPPLKPLKPYAYKDDCSKESEDLALSTEICIMCGDGKCSGVENKCNCSEDCK